MTIHDIATASGMTFRELARRFDIPYRTMENWSAGNRKCPEYVLKMMAKIIEFEKDPEE